MTSTSHEQTARTLLNQHLVLLDRQGKASEYSDARLAAGFVSGLLTNDRRFRSLMETARVEQHWLLAAFDDSRRELHQAKAQGFMPLPIPVPPRLEEHFGYSGCELAPFTPVVRNARYIGFYWSASHLYWEDGLGGRTDRSQGYLVWLQHPAVTGVLGSFRDRLGSDDGPLASHMWMLERHTRLLFIAPHARARNVLHAQWPREAFPDLSEEQGFELASRVLGQVSLPSSEEVLHAYEREIQQVKTLQSWLATYA